jgi:hypothetical protein
MKIAILAVVLAALAAPVRAEAPKLGVGAVFGVPFGITAKYWLDSRRAVQSHLGVSDGNLVIDSDYLLHFDGVLPRKIPNSRLPLYAGLGLKLKTEDPTFAGIRFVGGVSVLSSVKPIEFFAELAPVLRLAPGAGSALDGAVGIRGYF